MNRSYPVLAVMLLSSAVHAQAFRRTQTNIDSGACLFWPTRTFTYFVDAAGDDEIAGDAEFAAIDKAFAAERDRLSRQEVRRLRGVVRCLLGE